MLVYFIEIKKPGSDSSLTEEAQNFKKNKKISKSKTNLKKCFGIKVERNVMFIILSLIIIVAAFNIISGLTILVKNKTRDIGKISRMSSLSIYLQSSSK